MLFGKEKKGMKKTLFKSGMLIMTVLLTFTFLDVNAEEVYYTNLNGVEMTSAEYEKLAERFTIPMIENMTQEKFNKFITGTVVDVDVTYSKVITDNEGNIYEETVSEEEYNNAKLSSLSTCGEQIRSGDYNYFQTSYKRLYVTLSDYGNNDFDIMATLNWLQMPGVQSYDVFAFRVKHMSFTNVGGVQTYFVGSNYSNISYNSNSTGYKGLSNGAGISMNLKDGDDITSYQLTLLADLAINDWNYSTARVFVSYQHAMTDVTRAQSKSYTLEAGGLGDVIMFSDSTIENKYDGMSGVDVETEIE